MLALGFVVRCIWPFLEKCYNICHCAFTVQRLTCGFRCLFVFGRFLEAFQLLQNAPKEEHCWCNHREVMYPLLEPFSWYFEEPNPQSALHTLWRRLCSELSACTKCVKIHHEAKEEYKKEYDEVHVEPLLAVLQVKLPIFSTCLCYTFIPNPTFMVVLACPAFSPPVFIFLRGLPVAAFNGAVCLLSNF